jgi:hypothetical protein
MNRFIGVAGVLVVGLWAGSAGAVTDGPSLPDFNVHATCNRLQKVPEALSVNTGEQDAIRHCVEAEQKARNQLAGEWTKFTAADRHLCVGEANSGGVAPAYTELESCLQMTRDSRQLNNQEVGENTGQGVEAAPQSGPGPTAQNP